VTVSQKAALSLLISVFLFAGFAVMAFSGLFDLVESRFYNPSITKSLSREVALDGETIGNFLAEIQTRFAETLDEPAVQRSVLPNQSAGDIFERSRIFGVLLESLGGLQWVRFIDSGGARIHFSTAAQDILSQDRFSVAYRNYNDNPDNLPYDQVEVPPRGETKFTLDEAGNRIILSFPFYDSFEVYRGTALFSVSVRAVAERLISGGRIKVGDIVSIVSSPPGIVSGLPGTAQSNILSATSSIWNDGLLTLTPLDSTASEATLALISSKTSQGIFVGRLVNETLFSFPQPMKVILLVSIFLTIYLAIFLSFNLKQDSLTIIQNRLKGLQISLIEQYYDRKGDVDWLHWTRELEQRREDVRAEVKRGVRTGQGRRSEEDIDALIDKSWDELLEVLGGRRSVQADIDEEKLQNILNRILQAAPGLPLAAPAAQPLPAARPRPLPAAPRVDESPAEAEELEELTEEGGDLEEAEAVEELEELTELEDADAETAEAVEEVEELSEAEDAELVEEAEELAELEEPEESGDAAPGEGKNERSGGLLAMANRAAKESGTQPAPDFDVPYINIMESGDIALADADIDSVLGSMRSDDEPAELEELGEDEGEALEKPEEPKDTGKTEEAGPFPPSEAYLADLASRIEFSPLDTDEPADRDHALDTDFEIVSPFATMLSNISIADDTNPEDTGKETAGPGYIGMEDIGFMEEGPADEEPEELPAELPADTEPAAEAGGLLSTVDEEDGELAAVVEEPAELPAEIPETEKKNFLS
jgi:hypothetical protein